MWRLCSEQRLWSVFSRKRGLNRKAGPAVHDDLVRRDFTASGLNELWLADATEHWTAWIQADEGKLYLWAITDVHSNPIVGYSIDARMTAELAVAALRNAVPLRNPVETTLHPDRGSQFRSRKFAELLRQKNVLNKNRWSTRQEHRREIVTSIKRTYHRRHRQRRHGRLTPIEFEIINTHTAHAARKPQTNRVNQIDSRPV